MNFTKSVALVAATSLLVIISYFYFDRQLVDLLVSANSRQYHFLHYLQQLPEPLLYVAPVAILFYFIQRIREQKNKFAYFSLAWGVAVLVASGLKIGLKFCFGRYWPDTFKENNLSYVHDGIYGFEPFHGGVQYQSFPSGHMMTIVVFAFMLAAFYPKLKWISATAILIVALSLLGLYYHFVSDVLAGAVIGLLVSQVIFTQVKKRI